MPKDARAIVRDAGGEPEQARPEQAPPEQALPEQARPEQVRPEQDALESLRKKRDVLDAAWEEAEAERRSEEMLRRVHEQWRGPFH